MTGQNRQEPAGQERLNSGLLAPVVFLPAYAVFLRVFTHPPRFAEISFLVKIFIEKNTMRVYTT